MASTRVTNTATYGTVSIGTSAAVIKAAHGSRTSLVVQNAHATNTLYVGSDSSVTTSNGVVVAAGASVTFDDYTGDVYGIASGASTDVRYFQVGA